LSAAAWYITIICLSFLRSTSAKNDKHEKGIGARFTKSFRG
jgi:hypothetical protein